MKHIFIILVVLLLLTVTAFAEPQTIADATYQRLYNQVVSCLGNQSEDNNSLPIRYATLWKNTDTIAGFLFEGDEWYVMGEADTGTGIITRIRCRLPFTSDGLLMTYAILYAISGEQDPLAFAERYIPDDGILSDIPFPEYENIVDAGTEDSFIFEFVRSAAIGLHDNSNAFPMNSLIMQMQE